MIATSWKMNFTRWEARAYLRRLRDRLAGGSGGRTVFVLPPFTNIAVAEEELESSDIFYGAQDVHPEAWGAHTGDVSAPMLAELGCHIVEMGHPERRRDHCETSALIKSKVDAVLREGMWPLLCVGESARERDDGREKEVIREQLKTVLGHLDAQALARLIVAYEPLWAIGSGAIAAPLDHVGRLHRFIRDWLDEVAHGSASTPILYGGSVNVANAPSLLAVPGVDGSLLAGRTSTQTPSRTLF
jgi:triosephosphate isomerase